MGVGRQAGRSYLSIYLPIVRQEKEGLGPLPLLVVCGERRAESGPAVSVTLRRRATKQRMCIHTRDSTRVRSSGASRREALRATVGNDRSSRIEMRFYLPTYVPT
eukprot:GHVU01127572.1.p1 GENE.GHVU01127572.1~~GHVU01127572.1.p1  ORF type:complete len:105 (-),score=4.21 GHVU01127572.1:319-633(-)